MATRPTACSKSSIRPIPFALRTTAACVFGALHLAMAVGATLPEGGHFVAGKGQINSNCSGLDITQATSRGIIDWKNFFYR